MWLRKFATQQMIKWASRKRFLIYYTHVATTLKRVEGVSLINGNWARPFHLVHIPPGFSVSIWHLGILPLLQPQLLFSILPTGSDLNVKESTPWLFGWFSFVFLFVATSLPPRPNISRGMRWKGLWSLKQGSRQGAAEVGQPVQLTARLAITTYYDRGSKIMVFKCVQRCIHLPEAMLPCRVLTKARMQLQFIWCMSAGEYRIWKNRFEHLMILFFLQKMLRVISSLSVSA